MWLTQRRGAAMYEVSCNLHMRWPSGDEIESLLGNRLHYMPHGFVNRPLVILEATLNVRSETLYFMWELPFTSLMTPRTRASFTRAGFLPGLHGTQVIIDLTRCTFSRPPQNTGSGYVG